MGRPFKGKIFKCKQCHNSFKRSQCQVARGRTHFCSVMCSGKFRSGDKNPAYKHGHAMRGKVSPTWVAWNAMIDRCYSVTSSPYKKYGAKGVSVCHRWRDKDNGFVNFVEDMGERPNGKTLDRVDGSMGYSPNNCRWATPLQQANNQKSNVRVMWKGKKYNVSQLMRELGIHTRSGVYYTRLSRGWSVKSTFTTPIKTRK